MIESEKIPKRIIQFCHNINDAPKELCEAAFKTRSNLSGYEYILADDEFVKSILIESWDERLYGWYCKNKIPASRADMARLILLYHYGGFYVDLSMEMISSLDDYLNTDVTLLKRDDFERYKDDPSKAHFTNSIIGAPRESEFIALLISKMRFNFSAGCYQYDVIRCTGPGLINSIIGEYIDLLNVGIISFKKAKGEVFNYIRVQGFSNSWTKLQSQGILDTSSTNKKARRLQLHLGWPKVGSTSIQDFYQKFPRLENKYIYPVSGRPNGVRAHHQLVKYNFSGMVSKNLFKEVLGFEKVVISSEQGVADSFEPDFFKGLQGFLANFGRDYDVHIYLKNIYSLIESAYSQCLMTDLYDIVYPDYDKDINAFFLAVMSGKKSHIFKLGQVLSRFDEEVGSDNLTVKVVGFDTVSFDVLKDFVVNNGTKEFFDNQHILNKQSNASLSVPEKCVLYLANSAGLNRSDKVKVLNRYSEELKGLAGKIPSKSDFCNIVTKSSLDEINRKLDFFMPDFISEESCKYIFKEPDLNGDYITIESLLDYDLIKKVDREIKSVATRSIY